MYVTTFYSFKGGVGRTMALVNVAVELAQRGRRVLGVDFDLEAPGLDTFDIFRSRKRRPGIVDFVTEYLDTGRAPEVERFIHDSRDVGQNGGGLWVMPSGEQHGKYATSFREIDWLDLYERHDGYLLFEDLKAQWEQFVKPDYVLIDSRTGHTDTGGICTRQLPDAVAILFFPNEQNLRGLTKVVRDIRAEGEEPRKKEIDLHFVMSNVPDLDDEDRVLERKIDAFREKLGFRGEPLILHRYDSLSLLNQVVFAKERPRSRLAREYCDLVKKIVGCNLADRDGALEYIRQADPRRRRRVASNESAGEIDDRKLSQIEKAHARDGEVLFALGALMADDRQQDRAASLFHRSIEAGYRDPEAYLRRAWLHADAEDSAGAIEDALQILNHEKLPRSFVLDAARLVSADRAGDVAASVAVASMDAVDRIWLAGKLDRSEQIAVAVRLLRPIVDDDALSASERHSARNRLALRYLGIGACAAAAALLRDEARDVGEMDVQDVVFDYGMALWGETGQVVPGPFGRFLQLDEEGADDEEGEDGWRGANRHQRLAVAHWATGQPRRAFEVLEQARELAGSETWWSDPPFSCWRYQSVRPEEFMMDLDEIEALIDGDTTPKPRFMTAAAPNATE